MENEENLQRRGAQGHKQGKNRARRLGCRRVSPLHHADTHPCPPSPPPSRRAGRAGRQGAGLGGACCSVFSCQRPTGSSSSSTFQPVDRAGAAATGSPTTLPPVHHILQTRVTTTTTLPPAPGLSLYTTGTKGLYPGNWTSKADCGRKCH